MEWVFLLKPPGEENVSVIRVFYANWDVQDEENLIPIRGRLIDLSHSALCKFLGVPVVPIISLIEFIKHPAYRAIRHTLCGVSSDPIWICDKKKRTHNCLPMAKFLRLARVWLKLIGMRILPGEHNINVVSMCLIYFLMTRQPVSLGYLMRCEIALTMTGKLSRMYYGNVFTKYLCSGVEEDPDSYIVLLALTRSFDITRFQGPEEDGLSTLTAPECNAQDECLSAHLYGMTDLLLQIGGRSATKYERQ